MSQAPVSPDVTSDDKLWAALALSVLMLCKKGCKIELWKNKHVTDREGFLKK